MHFDSSHHRKWLWYLLGGLLPVLILDCVILPRLLPVLPMLLPVCVVAAAVLEGSVFGARFGLITGFFWYALYPVSGAGTVFLMTAVGMAVGAVGQYALHRTLSGCMVCTLGVLTLMEGMRWIQGMLHTLAPSGQLLSLILQEGGLTLLFTPMIYLLFSHLARKGA